MVDGPLVCDASVRRTSRSFSSFSFSWRWWNMKEENTLGRRDRAAPRARQGCGPRRPGAPVGERDVLYRRPARLRLREEPHVARDLVRHVGVDREPEAPQDIDVERVGVRTL